jgi:nucleotide-binding universal stress UspA family protein
MGSTALSILQRSTVAVLTVPSRGTTSASMPAPSWPGEWILAPLELDAESRTEVDVAARLAQWFESSLLLLHVVSKITAPAWLRHDLSAHDRIRLGQAQQEIDVLAAAARQRVKTETRVTCGRAADEIAALAASERASLLVTALRDRHGWFGARRGSVSYHVLSHAVSPVLAYPPQWRPR